MRNPDVAAKWKTGYGQWRTIIDWRPLLCKKLCISTPRPISVSSNEVTLAGFHVEWVMLILCPLHIQ